MAVNVKSMEDVTETENSVVNALTIDVEEWYQTILFLNTVYNDGQPTDLPKNIHEILKLLDGYNAKATFFVLGSVAKKYPNLIKQIASQGHEIGSHGHRHKLVYKMTKQEFRDDVISSLNVLRKVSGNEIHGYRASTWSITKNQLWAIEILKSLGFKYDSSVYPISCNLLQCKEQQKHPYKILEDFIEFPPSVFQFFGYNFPFAGGTFLRYFPINFIANRISSINKAGHPAMVYFHSWEFSDAVPIKKMPRWKWLIQYRHLKSVKIKINFLLKKFKFARLKDVLKRGNNADNF